MQQHGQPAANTDPVDRRQHLVEATEHVHALAERVRGVRIRQPGHLCEVLTGAERSPRARQHDHTDRVVVHRALKRGSQLAPALRIERVAALWWVEGDEANVACAE